MAAKDIGRVIIQYMHNKEQDERDLRNEIARLKKENAKNNNDNIIVCYACSARKFQTQTQMKSGHLYCIDCYATLWPYDL